MFKLHLFPSAEYHYDVISGCDSEFTRTFSDQTQAELWFKEEYGDSGWCFLGDAELQQQRAELKQSVAS